MILNFNVTLEDVIAFNNAKYLTSFKIKSLSIFYSVVASITILLFTFFISLKEHNFGFIGLGILLIPVFFWYFKCYPGPMIEKERRRISKLVNKIYTADVCERLLGHLEMLISEDNFIVKAKYYETRYLWKIVQDVIITENHIFILTSPGTSEIIPKKSIGQQTFDELITFLKIKAEKIRK